MTKQPSDQPPPDRPFAKKSLGQHWLQDPAILADIVRSAAVGPRDTVLEIGPGPGSLTAELVRVAGRVVAVELDERLAVALPSRVPAANLQVAVKDILQFDLRQLPVGYKVVANVPYYLTGQLLRRLSEAPNPPAAAVLLLQREVAERVAAEPGALSVLGVTTQFYWRVRLGRQVPARCFTPPPKVDSQVLILERRPEPLFANAEPQAFFRLVRAGFAQPRKTLLNNLSAGLQLDRPDVESVCRGAGIDPQRRAQTLSLEEWHALYLAWRHP